MTSVSSLTSLSAKTGIGGLVSGMDLDELVKNLTMRSRERILKQQQDIQKLEWKQTAYRSVTNALNEFQSSYLDLLSSTNLRNASFFNTVKATSSSSAVSVNATAVAMEGSIIINSITQLAERQRVSSGARISPPLEGKNLSEIDINSLQGKSFSLNLDGRVRTVILDDDFIAKANADGLVDALQGAVDKAFGVTKPGDRLVEVSLSGDNLTFSTSVNSSQLSVRAVGGDIDTLEALGLSDGQSNRVSLYHSLDKDSPVRCSLAERLHTDPRPGFDPGSDPDTFNFTINSVNFSFRKEMALTDVISQINASNAGVTISYSSISDTFTLTAKETGAGENIVIEETQGNLMETLGLVSARDNDGNIIAGTGPEVHEGQNAILRVNGIDMVRTSNNITVDGVNIELLHATKDLDDPSITISLKEDSSTLIEPIKKFIEDYNSLLDLMNGFVMESVYSNFQPLSDEQKSEMTEKQIEQWEEKAKSGILRSDPVLKGIVTELRSIMISAATSGGITLFDMGVSSGGWQEHGKLQITKEGEAKLAEALKTRGSEIADLFTSAETGLANRMHDVIRNATKTSGTRNNRGTLIDLAGLESTSSQTENSISDRIKNTNKRIDALQLRLTAEESRLWRQFTAMETALQRLSAQGSIIMQFSENNYR